jgi:hypothetical protein
MTPKQLYFCLAIFGLVLPYSQFIPFLQEHGLDLRLMLEQLFANRISAFFGLDVIVSAVVLLLFMWVEGRRLGMSRLWLPVLATLTVGVSLALPLFLYLRETHQKLSR